MSTPNITDVGTAKGGYPEVERITDQTVKSALRVLWDRVMSLTTIVRGPESGLLLPDQRPPNLGPMDVGREFFSSDFNRSYKWDGSQWQDAPTAPPRFEVAFFASTPEPSIGWVPCDGRRTARSTSDGRVQLFQTPVMTPNSGLQAYIRV